MALQMVVGENGVSFKDSWLEQGVGEEQKKGLEKN